MCATVFIGNIQITTVKEFIDETGLTPINENGYCSLNPDGCLCQIKIGETLESAGVIYDVDEFDNYII